MLVGTDGKPHGIRVERGLGLGLDEQAVAAVQQWKFEPAFKDGKPVVVSISVEIQFHLDRDPALRGGGFDSESAALRAIFDSLAERILKADFEGAYKFLSEKSAKSGSLECFAGSYQQLEAKNGKLKSIHFDGSWADAGGDGMPVKTGMVMARHRYESKDVVFTYVFHHENEEWKLVDFRPSDPIPPAVVH